MVVVTVNPALRTLVFLEKKRPLSGVSSLIVYTPVFILSVGPLGPEKKVVLEAGSFLTTSVLKAGLTVP